MITQSRPNVKYFLESIAVIKNSPKQRASSKLAIYYCFSKEHTARL